MSGQQTAPSNEPAARPWLVALKDKAMRDDRPRDKPSGRWLGDFLRLDTPNGLLKTELDLLDACAAGTPCEPSPRPPEHPAGPAGDAGQSPLGQSPAAQPRAALLYAVEPNSVRAGFLRFLALGGDEFAPVHEAGIELHNALIDGGLDLRGGKCVGRLMLLKCVLPGDLTIEDASLGTLVLSGSWVAGIAGNRATISGTVLLNANFVSDGRVSLFSARIGGSLNFNTAEIKGVFTCARANFAADLVCDNASFAHGIEAQGAVITGNARFSSATAKHGVSLASAEIGGSLWCSGATFMMDKDDIADAGLDFSRASIKGDAWLNSPAKENPFRTNGVIRFVSAQVGGNVYFWGSRIGPEGGEEKERLAIDAQNVTVNGSMFFGGGFEASGEVALSGAEILKDLDFCDSLFRNQPGYAILAERAKVAGAVRCQTLNPEPDGLAFQSFGVVSLANAQCGEINCSGGTFNNPGLTALDCSNIDVAGPVMLRNVGTKPFEAHGSVLFYTARIGQHLNCGGGRFSTPQGVALNCEGSRITSCVFLNGCDTTNVEDKEQAAMAFQADGKVTFVGATIGLQVNCLWGRFRNAAADPSNGAYADAALDLSVARIGDTLILGVGTRKSGTNEPDRLLATIEGRLDLEATTVRALADDGLTNDATRGLRPTVTGEDGNTRRCNLKLDLFSYDRLTGDDACKASLRIGWLRRQPPEDLEQAFRPQPFEQLVSVLRAMGHDDEADDIALAKRKYAWRSRPWWVWSLGPRPVVNFLAKLGELVFVDLFLGYGYKISRALIVLLVLGIGFALFYQTAFRQGAIVPADQEVLAIPLAVLCPNWSQAACPVMASKPIPPFNPWIYSADVMIPIIGFGQKAAWAPANNKSLELPLLGRPESPTNLVYGMQLAETVLGWIGGLLLVSFVTGLTTKE